MLLPLHIWPHIVQLHAKQRCSYTVTEKARRTKLLQVH
jgi:hypothetical protein